MIRSWIERAYWSWMLSTSKTVRVDGLSFIHISAEGGRSSQEIEAALREALARIATAKGGFGELVTSHLRFVAALDGGRSVALVHARGYVSPFPSVEIRNAHFLACRLIRAATHVRLSRDILAQGKPRDLDSIRVASHAAQVRFTKQFADAEEWIEYLNRNPSGI
jgi:hypothetical protein